MESLLTPLSIQLVMRRTEFDPYHQDNLALTRI